MYRLAQLTPPRSSTFSGSIVGSLLGGGMLALGWEVTTVYALVAIPALVVAAALLILGAAERRRHARR